MSNKLLKIANETFKSQQLDNPFFFLLKINLN